MSFTAPPPHAIFFRDDTATGRGEQFTGVVEALRISGVARTGAEIDQVQQSVNSPPVTTAGRGQNSFASLPSDGGSLDFRFWRSTVTCLAP